MKCENCSGVSYDGAKYCIWCGSPLPRKSKSVAFFASCFKAVLYFALFFGIQLIFSFAYGLIVGIKITGLHGLMSEDEYLNLYQQEFARNIHAVTIAAAAVTIFMLAVFFAIRHKNLLKETHLGAMRFWNYPVILLLGIALQFFCAFTISLIPLPESWFSSHDDTVELLTQGSFWIQFIDVAVVTAIVEEIIFRGLVYTRLKRGMPKVIAVILSALIFGAAHGNILSFIYTSLLGVLLVLIYERAGSLMAPILCHFAFNAASLFLSFLSIESLLLFFSIYLASAGTVVGTVFLVLAVVNKKRCVNIPENSNSAGIYIIQ